MINPKVERWRTLVINELNSQGSSVPCELILSIIQQESGGEASAFNSGSNATGLMQIKPIVVKTYNSNFSPDYSNKDMLEPAKNLRVGIWLLRHNYKKCKGFFHKEGYTELPSDTLGRIALVGYRMGWPATEEKLAQFVDEGATSITYASFKARFKMWGWSNAQQKWINKPFDYVDDIYSRADTLSPIVEFESRDSLQNTVIIVSGVCLLIGALLIVVYMVNK